MPNSITNSLSTFINCLLQLKSPRHITSIKQLTTLFHQISTNPLIFDITYPQSFLSHNIYSNSPYCAFHTIFDNQILTIYGWFDKDHITFHCKY